MKIGIEAQRIFREHKHGMDFVALETIRNLQRLDSENQYFIYVNEGPDTACLKETENFTIRMFGGPYPIWEQLKLPKMAEQDGVEVLHCTSNTAPVKLSIPLVVTIHDIIYFETHPLKAKGYTAYQKFGNLYRRWVVKRLLKTANKILTVSKYEQKRFYEYLNLPEGAVEVVYNGVASHFKPIDDKDLLQAKREQYHLPAHFFLFLGNTDPKKNTENTVVAFAKYCEQNGTKHKLVIGDLDPTVIRSFLAKAGLEKYFSEIHFTGYIQNTDLPAIINLAEVFLYPSKRESFGIPVLEGMASGTPVITSNTSSMPEVAGDAAYLVNPLNLDEIVAGLSKLVQDASLRKTLRDKGLERAKQFSWENTARQSLNMYKSVVDATK